MGNIIIILSSSSGNYLHHLLLTSNRSKMIMVTMSRNAAILLIPVLFANMVFGARDDFRDEPWTTAVTRQIWQTLNSRGNDETQPTFFDKVIMILNAHDAVGMAIEVPKPMLNLTVDVLPTRISTPAFS